MDSKPNQPIIIDVEPFKDVDTVNVKTIKVAQPQPTEVNIYRMSKMQKLFSKLLYGKNKAIGTSKKILNNRFMSPITSTVAKSGLMSKYIQERDRLKREKRERDLLEEVKYQTKILKELDDKDGNSAKGGLLSKVLGFLGSISKNGLKLLAGVTGISKVLSLLSPLKNKILPNRNKAKPNKKGGAVKKFGKLIAKKLGLIGAVLSGVSGISDYKEWRGLSEEYNTTIREKITGALSGIGNGFKDFVKFISLGTIDLWEDEKAFEVLDNITTNMKQSFDNMLSGFPKLQAGINTFVDGVNSLLNTSADGLSKLYDWGVEFTRKQSEDEKAFVKSMDRRKNIEERYNEGQGLFESNKEYKKRRDTLSKELDQAKKEELKYAKKALKNSDFNTNSRFKYDAILSVEKSKVEKQSKQVEKYSKWKEEYNQKDTQIKTVKESIESFKEQLKDTKITKKEKEIAEIKIKAFSISLENLTKQLEEINLKKPKVDRVEVTDLQKSYPNAFPKNINHMDINKNKINPLTNKKGGTISWRNNNAGNLKYVYKEAVGQGKTTSKRSYQKALKKAQSLNEGVLALDRYGYAVFDTKEHGDLAKAKLLTKKHGNRTIEQMLPKYAIDDYTGKANHKAYANSIYKTAKQRGVSLKGKKIKDMTESELLALMQGMEKFEGYKEGTYMTPNANTQITKTAYAQNTIETVQYKNSNTTKEYESMKETKIKRATKEKEVTPQPQQTELANGLNRVVQAINNQNTHISKVVSTTNNTSNTKVETKQPSENIVFNTTLQSKEVGV